MLTPKDIESSSSSGVGIATNGVGWFLLFSVRGMQPVGGGRGLASGCAVLFFVVVRDFVGPKEIMIGVAVQRLFDRSCRGCCHTQAAFVGADNACVAIQPLRQSKLRVWLMTFSIKGN